VLTPASLDRRARSTGAISTAQRNPAFPSGGTVVAAAFARAEAGGAFAESDREEIERVIGVVARGGGQLLVQGRASRPELLPEAGRRAESVMLDAALRAHVDPGRIRTRVTLLRADDPVVELQVSALRDGPSRSLDGPSAAGALPRLEPGEAGLRQVREALAARRGEMEGCLAPVALRLDRPDTQVPLRLAVAPDGRVGGLSAADGPYASDDVQQCLARIAAGWRLPVSDGGYDALVLIATLGRRR
jgi:hypothetical protein